VRAGSRHMPDGRADPQAEHRQRDDQKDVVILENKREQAGERHFVGQAYGGERQQGTRHPKSLSVGAKLIRQSDRYPLRPVSWMPSMKYRCKKKNRMIVGAITTVDAAINTS